MLAILAAMALIPDQRAPLAMGVAGLAGLALVYAFRRGVLLNTPAAGPSG
jgi:hypothetical protein